MNWEKVGADEMGLVVEVSEKLRRVTKYDPAAKSKVQWKRTPVHGGPRAGWVVGYRDLQEGTVWKGRWDLQRELRVDNRVRVIEVVFWPTMNSVHVLPDAITYPADLKPESPTARNFRRWKEESPKQYKAYCEEMKSIMKTVPRDKSGRWK